MFTPNRITRAGALALAGLTAAVTAGGSPERAEAPEPSRLAAVARLVPIAGVRDHAVGTVATAPLPRGASQLRPARLPQSIERVATRALRREEGAPRFPVAGQFNWGQEGARFGAARGGRAHEGQDIFGRTGTLLLAVASGVVLEAGEDGGRGNYLALYDPQARRTYVYLHLQGTPLVGRGQRVRSGQPVGALGCTGSCFGDHLHFEVRHGRGLDGRAEDPLQALLGWSRRSRSRATLPPGAR